MYDLYNRYVKKSYSELVEFGLYGLKALEELHNKYAGKGIQFYDFPMMFVFALYALKVKHASTHIYPQDLQYICDVINTAAGSKGDLYPSKVRECLNDKSLVDVYVSYMKCMCGNADYINPVGGLLASMGVVCGKVFPEDVEGNVSYLKESGGRIKQ